jgi:hypothetical protein
MSDLDLDDDSDSSDIENLFAQAQRKKRVSDVQDARDSEEDSDDDSDNDDNDAFWDTGRKKQKQMSVEARLSQMEQLSSIRERQRSAKEANSDDSDEDEDVPAGNVRGVAVARVDKNAVKLQVEIRTIGQENQKNAVVWDSDDDSSDDDDEAAPVRKGPVSLNHLKQQGVSQEMIEGICKSRQALEELKEAQRYHAQDIRPSPAAIQAAAAMNQQQYQQQYQQYPYQNQPQQPQYGYGAGAGAGGGIGMPYVGADMLGNMQLAANLMQGGANTNAALLAAGNPFAQAGAHMQMQMQMQQPPQGPGRILQVTVRARLERIGCEPTYKETIVTIYNNETVQVLTERFMAMMNLTPDNSVVTTMQCNGQSLMLQRTLQMYGMQEDSVVDAVVILTGLGDFQARAPPAAAVSANLGKSIQLTLRHQDGKTISQDVFTIRMKETFQLLADKYRVSKSLDASMKVTFKFDGATMSLTRTPESYDMEDEDLVDLILQ